MKDDRLWKAFSEFIRKRDSVDGMCICITCGKKGPWKEFDAGHFISRRQQATKYNEKNVNAQCRYCNRFNQGVQYKYSLAIDKKFGKGTAEQLEQESRMICKRSQVDIDYMTSHYKALIK